MELVQAVFYLSYSLTVDIGIYMCLRVWCFFRLPCQFCTVEVLWLDQSPLQVVVKLECYFQKHCLCTRNGNTAVGWQSGVERWWFLSVESQCFVLLAVSMVWIVLLFLLWQVLGLLLRWLVHPITRAAYGLPVVELATSFTPCSIWWTPWSSS